MHIFHILTRNMQIHTKTDWLKEFQLISQDQFWTPTGYYAAKEWNPEAWWAQFPLKRSRYCKSVHRLISSQASGVPWSPSKPLSTVSTISNSQLFISGLLVFIILNGNPMLGAGSDRRDHYFNPPLREFSLHEHRHRTWIGSRWTSPMTSQTLLCSWPGNRACF